MDEASYGEIARKVCSVIGLEVSNINDLESLVSKLQTWASNMVYFTSTQKDIIDDVRQIIKDISKGENKETILQKVEKLENDVCFDRYND
ncbi:hypothetical protein MUP01_09135 [Candidatus Bathyarchaeota archaeon]|nr:hypothetical protein [Candidatus Bathyarchaeota archaeon]